MPFIFANNISTTLAAPVSSGATTIMLSSSANLPASIPTGVSLAITLNDASTRQNFEIVYATAISGTTLTVTRGQEGTAALSWSTGDFVFSGPTAGQQPQYIQLAHGECQLQFVSATSIKLVDFNGSNLVIQGVQWPIPSGGISISNAGLAASTLYYAYARMVSGSMALALSTTGHSTDTTASNLGVEIKTGDNTQTLVGMIVTNASSQFSDGATQRWVRSWFNRNSRDLYANAAGAVSSTTPVELTSALRTNFLSWAGEVVDMSVFGTGASNTAAQGFNVQLAVDNAVVGISSTSTSPVAGYAQTVANRFVTSALSEGSHYATVFGSTFGGATITYTVSKIGRVG